MEALVIINTIGLVILAVYYASRTVTDFDPEDYVCDVDDLENEFRQTQVFTLIDEALKDHKKVILELADAVGLEHVDDEVQTKVIPGGFRKKKKVTKKKK